MLIIGELLKQADLYISEVLWPVGLTACCVTTPISLPLLSPPLPRWLHTPSQGLHPRILVEGLEKAKEKTLSVSLCAERVRVCDGWHVMGDM